MVNGSIPQLMIDIQKLSTKDFFLSKDFFVYMLIAFCFCLPFKMFLCNVIAIILFGYVIFKSWYSKKIEFNGNQLLFWCSMSLFALQLGGLLFSQDIKNGLFSTEKRIGLLLFPLVFHFCQHKLNSEDIKRILSGLIWGMSLGTIYSLLLEVIQNFYINHFDEYLGALYSDTLLENIGINHLDYGLYAAFSLCNIFYMYLSHSKELNKTYFVNASIIIIGLLLMIPKMGVISLIMATIYISIFSNWKPSFSQVISIFLFIVITVAAVWQLPKSKERFRQFSYGFAKENLANDAKSYSSTRAGSFYCSVDLLRSYGLLGLGTGGVEPEMNKWFEWNNLPALKGLDTHNQYFDYCLSFGILGLIVFCLCLFCPLYLFHNSGFYVGSAFIIIMLFSFLTENYLNNNKGVMFFCFFNSLFASVLNIKSNVIR